MPIDLEIVSPERLLLSRAVEMVVIPAAEGEIGVLQGHAPMIVLLRGGTLRLYEGNAVTDTLFVGGGFAEITPTRCTVLAAEVMPLADVSREAADAKLAAATQRYESADKMKMDEVDQALADLQSAQAMREAAQHA